MNDPFNQELPHKDEAERTVLGAMLQSRTAIDEARQKITENDFYQPNNKTIYHLICDLSDQHGDVDTTLLCTTLTERKMLDHVGGLNYVGKLIDYAPTTSNVGIYADMVKDAAKRRDIIAIGTRIAQMGHANDADTDSIIGNALNEAFHIGEDDSSTDYKDIYTVSTDMLAHLDKIQKGEIAEGVHTGFRDIDDVTHGLQPGQMIVVAGRPAMGKSTLGMDFARNAAIHDDQCTVVFSLEMSREEIAQRLFSAETNIPLNVFRDPSQMTDERWRTVNGFWQKLEDKPLYIDDSANLKIPDIRAKCRRLKETKDLKLVVVDYLQLMSSRRMTENRQQEVSDFSRQFKLLAKELQVPVVILSQLNRNVEMRADKVPQMSDLRESGSIEQDADVVFLVHRPDAYDKEDRPGEADIIMAKHRNGPTETFHLAFLGSNSKFKDMPQDYMSSNGL